MGNHADSDGEEKYKTPLQGIARERRRRRETGPVPLVPDSPPPPRQRIEYGSLSNANFKNNSHEELLLSSDDPEFLSKLIVNVMDAIPANWTFVLESLRYHPLLAHTKDPGACTLMDLVLAVAPGCNDTRIENVVSALVQCGVCVDRTPIMGIRWGFTVTKELLEHGADPGLPINPKNGNAILEVLNENIPNRRENALRGFPSYFFDHMKLYLSHVHNPAVWHHRLDGLCLDETLDKVFDELYPISHLKAEMKIFSARQYERCLLYKTTVQTNLDIHIPVTVLVNVVLSYLNLV